MFRVRGSARVIATFALASQRQHVLLYTLVGRRVFIMVAGLMQYRSRESVLLERVKSGSPPHKHDDVLWWGYWA